MELELYTSVCKWAHVNLQEVCGYVDLVGVYEVRRCVTEYALHKQLFLHHL